MSMKKHFGHIVAESVKIVHDFILLQWVNNWFELYQSAIENAIISFFELLTKNPYSKKNAPQKLVGALCLDICA